MIRSRRRSRRGRVVVDAAVIDVDVAGRGRRGRQVVVVDLDGDQSAVDAVPRLAGHHARAAALRAARRHRARRPRRRALHPRHDAPRRPAARPALRGPAGAAAQRRRPRRRPPARRCVSSLRLSLLSLFFQAFQLFQPFQPFQFPGRAVFSFSVPFSFFSICCPN